MSAHPPVFAPVSAALGALVAAPGRHLLPAAAGNLPLLTAALAIWHLRRSLDLTGLGPLAAALLAGAWVLRHRLRVSGLALALGEGALPRPATLWLLACLGAAHEAFWLVLFVPLAIEPTLAWLALPFWYPLWLCVNPTWVLHLLAAPGAAPWAAWRLGLADVGGWRGRLYLQQLVANLLGALLVANAFALAAGLLLAGQELVGADLGGWWDLVLGDDALFGLLAGALIFGLLIDPLRTRLLVETWTWARRVRSGQDLRRALRRVVAGPRAAPLVGLLTALGSTTALAQPLGPAPAPDVHREQAQRILSRPEFASGAGRSLDAWWAHGSQDARDWLAGCQPAAEPDDGWTDCGCAPSAPWRAATDGALGCPQPEPAGFLGAALLLAGTLTALIVLRRRAGRTPAAGDPAAQALAPGASSTRALELAESGQYGAAVRQLYIAALRRLHERQTIVLQIGMTDHQVAAQLPPHFPAGELRALARLYQRAWYGAEELTRVDWERAGELYRLALGEPLPGAPR